LQQCGPYRWERQYNDEWLVRNSVEVNEFLVKAKLPPTNINTHTGIQMKDVREETGGTPYTGVVRADKYVTLCVG